MKEVPLTPLRIAATEEVAEGIRSFELVHPEGAELPAFTPGAHVQVLVPGGELRKYSLCNDAAERHRYVITVKREAGGRGGSISLVDGAWVGAPLAVSAPENAFDLVPSRGGYLFIAGGIGITPILSMIRTMGEPPPAPWRLVYLTRSAAATAYLQELVAPTQAGKVFVHHDEGVPERAFDLWPLLEKPTAQHIYCCGPRALMDAVRDMSGHWSASQVHFESFVEGSVAMAGDQPFTVTLARSGRTLAVPVGRSILDVVRDAGCDVASSCESGTCGTCRTALLSGQAEHRDMVLMPDEQAGQIMVCVSRAAGGELVLDL